MSKGIANCQIENALKNLNDGDLNENFQGVFPANQMNGFIDYKSMISEKKGKYHFIIANTDRSDKSGTHWWSIMDIEPQADLFIFVHLA